MRGLRRFLCHQSFGAWFFNRPGRRGRFLHCPWWGGLRRAPCHGLRLRHGQGRHREYRPALAAAERTRPVNQQAFLHLEARIAIGTFDQHDPIFRYCRLLGKRKIEPEALAMRNKPYGEIRARRAGLSKPPG
jgi:hypothetical protein